MLRGTQNKWYMDVKMGFKELIEVNGYCIECYYIRVRIFVQVTMYRSLRIGRDSHRGYDRGISSNTRS